MAVLMTTTGIPKLKQSTFVKDGPEQAITHIPSGNKLDI
jgi:hypothetical protein